MADRGMPRPTDDSLEDASTDAVAAAEADAEGLVDGEVEGSQTSCLMATACSRFRLTGELAEKEAAVKEFGRERKRIESQNYFHFKLTRTSNGCLDI